MLRIDAAAALSESENAWTSDGRWQYCAGETYGRKRTCHVHPGSRNRLEDGRKRPCLNYRIRCGGGDYVIWLLCRFATGDESFAAVGVDGAPLAPHGKPPGRKALAL